MGPGHVGTCLPRRAPAAAKAPPGGLVWYGT